jgi:ligand-binding SRPBCC domain-containing protein
VPEGVEMTDRVEYELPFGPIGRLAHALWVRSQLRKIFDFREAVIGQLFAKSPR